MVSTDDARRALTTIRDFDWADSAISSVNVIDEGVNDSFFVRFASDEETQGTATPDSDRLFIKFATVSRPESFDSGIAAFQLLSTYTDLPVPTIHAVSSGTTELPAFYVAEYLPGDSLDNPTEPFDTTPARRLGQVIDRFTSIPSSAVDGYGPIREWERGEQPQARTEYDDFPTWLVEHAEALYDDVPTHDNLECVAPDVPAFIRSNRDQLPSTPDPSVVVTDFGPSNLLVTDGSSPETDEIPPAEKTEDEVQELTGVIDLERAAIGPARFTAVNAEYLMNRWIDTPDRLVDALYEPLSFGPNIPARELYWLVAMGRSVDLLDRWYEPGSELYNRRGDIIASMIDRIIN